MVPLLAKQHSCIKHYTTMSNDKLNWATLAPETRIYKGKNLFRWDESPGLGKSGFGAFCGSANTSIEHHCGMCATPLHSKTSSSVTKLNTDIVDSRAKTTCLGKHVEPCYRYHQQLHFVGMSSTSSILRVPVIIAKHFDV